MNLFEYDIEGENTIQLSHFDENLELYIARYRISHDGRYIALAISTADNDPNKDGYNFAVYDFQKNVATNYCIEATHELYPYWSPDDRQVMFLRPAQFSNTGKDQVILLDINSDLAISVAEDATPKGWIVPCQSL